MAKHSPAVFGVIRGRAWKCGFIGLAVLFFCALSLAQAQAPTVVSSLVVSKLNADETITLDGTLSHPAWQRAAPFDSFIERDPKNGAAPAYRTVVRVLVSEHALYFGIEALDPEPSKIRAPMVRHDGVNRTQDFVAVYVDAVGARKAAQFFRVSASGSTADGLHTAENDNEDFAPDFDFDSAAAIDDKGYTAVLRIPFVSLRYARESKESWKTLIVRRLPREKNYLIASVTIPAEVQSFIATMQPLEGVSRPENSQFLTLRPTLALKRSTQDGVTESSTTLGAEIKWRPTAQWVIDATIKPDFSQVELDVPQLSRNTRFAQSLTEKRPFFLESSDLLQTLTPALYTRSFTQPRWGARASWRGDGAAGTALLLSDEGGGTVLLPDAYATGYAMQPAYQGFAMRALANESSYTLGMTASHRNYNEIIGGNTVVGIDSFTQLTPSLKLRAQLLTSNTTAQPDAQGELVRADATRGTQLQMDLNHKSDEWEAAGEIWQASKGYRNDSGFTNQSGARQVSGNLNRIWRNVESPLGALNEFWLYTWVARTEALAQPQMISGYITPGLYINAARNTDFTLEYRGWDWARLSPTSPLHRQAHVHLEYGLQPAEWWSRFQLNFDVGRLVDYSADVLRPGTKFTLSSQLRAHRLLEVEPQISQVVLKGANGIAYRESAAQLLAVLHLSATQKLRYIGQQTLYEATGNPTNKSNTHSLTYSLRKSAGTIAYVGVSSNRGTQTGVGAFTTRGTEWFAKL